MGVTTCRVKHLNSLPPHFARTHSGTLLSRSSGEKGGRGGGGGRAGDWHKSICFSSIPVRPCTGAIAQNKITESFYTTESVSVSSISYFVLVYITTIKNSTFYQFLIE